RSLGCRKGLQRLADQGLLGNRSERRDFAEASIDCQLKWSIGVGSADRDLAGMAAQFDVDRPRCGGGRDTESLRDDIRQSLRGLDFGVPLSDRLEHVEIADLLINLAVPCLGRRSA